MPNKIIKIVTSHEPCVEAGWKAWDLYLSSPTDKEWVLSLRDMGALTFLPQLRKPFFKVESHHYIIKGILGENYVRMAMPGREHLPPINDIQEIEKLFRSDRSHRGKG